MRFPGERVLATVWGYLWQWLLRPRRLKTLMAAMTLSLVVPAVAFSSYLVARSEQQKRAQIDQQLVQASSDLTNDVEREFERILTLLDTLALSSALKERDFASFHATATSAVKRLGTNVILVDAGSVQLLNTRVPYGTPLPRLTDVISVSAVRSTKAPVISNVFIGAVANRPVFNVLLPLTHSTLTDHILIIAVDADHLLKIMRTEKLPSGWVFAIADRDGRIVARSKDQSKSVGHLLPRDVLASGRNNSEAYSTVNTEGVPTLRSVSREKTSGWLISASVPLTNVNAEVRRSQAALILGTLGLLTLAAGLAALFARLINDPMRALAASAVTLEGNEIPALLASPVVEANNVAAVLRAASIELQSRTQLLRASENRLTLAQRTAQLAYADLDLAAGTVTVSDTFAGVLGFALPPNDISEASRVFLSHVHRDDRARITKQTSQSLQYVGSIRDKFRIVRPDGEMRWISSHSETFADTSGQPARMLFTTMDVTQTTLQDEHIRFLLREVSHRSKNLLAVIQAMATQTGRSSPDYAAFQIRFSQRLQGMAASHDLLVNEDWRGVDVATLVRAQLRPFADERGGRLELMGPSLLLKPEAAQSLGMALHELATNATKYGALSVPHGKVDISWQTTRTDDSPKFQLTWRESNGPLVADPTRKGFGHIVFERMIKQALNASINWQYPPNGVVWSLDTALDQVMTV